MPKCPASLSRTRPPASQAAAKAAAAATAAALHAAKTVRQPWETHSSRQDFDVDDEDDFAKEPSVFAFEAVGLEVAVRAWWRGAPGHGEVPDQWVRCVVAKGVARRAKTRLCQSGIPSAVLASGLKLGEFLQKDEDLQQLWRQCNGQEVLFVNAAVDDVFRRFVVRVAPITVQDGALLPSRLIVTPRGPSAVPSEPVGRLCASAPLPSTSSHKACASHRSDRRHSDGCADGRASAPPCVSAPTSPRRQTRTRATTDQLPRVTTKSEDLHPRAQSAQHLQEKPMGDSLKDRMRGTPSCEERGSPSHMQRRRTWSNFTSWMRLRDRLTKELQNQVDVKEMEKQLQLQEEVAKEPPMVKNGHGAKFRRKVVRDLDEIRRLFQRFDSDESGTIDPDEFMHLLSMLMKVPICLMDMGEMARTWDVMDVSGSGKVTFEEFQVWYCKTFGIEQVQDFTDFFTDPSLVPAELQQLRTVAKRLGLDNLQVEKIWKYFKDLDEDESGSLEFDEFKILVTRLMTQFSKTVQIDVPLKVIRSFWFDVDSDRSGHITFEEFARWYVRFFHGDLTPMEQYYKMIGSRLRH